jgi:hypothetical protein
MFDPSGKGSRLGVCVRLFRWLQSGTDSMAAASSQGCLSLLSRLELPPHGYVTSSDVL